MTTTQLTYEQIEHLEIQASAACRESGSPTAWNAINTPDNVLALIQEIKRLREESYQVVSESMLRALALGNAEQQNTSMESRTANALAFMEEIAARAEVESRDTIHNLALSALRCLRREPPSSSPG